jgi:hypothetical protein
MPEVVAGVSGRARHQALAEDQSVAYLLALIVASLSVFGIYSGLNARHAACEMSTP